MHLAREDCTHINYSTTSSHFSLQVESVSSAMVNAGVALIDEQPEPDKMVPLLTPMLETFLVEASTSEEDDRARMGAVVCLGALARHISCDDPKVNAFSTFRMGATHEHRPPVRLSGNDELPSRECRSCIFFCSRSISSCQNWSMLSPPLPRSSNAPWQNPSLHCWRSPRCLSKRACMPHDLCNRKSPRTRLPFALLCTRPLGFEQVIFISAHPHSPRLYPALSGSPF